MPPTNPIESPFWSICDQLFKHSWWVFAFLFACVIFYERSLQEREQLYLRLNEQLSSLQRAKQEALLEQQNLRLQIESQNDVVWIELTLMKVLGLVPENQQKIYFSPAPPIPPFEKSASVP